MEYFKTSTEFSDEEVEALRHPISSRWGYILDWPRGD
jgi:hypothetical protein